MRQGAIDWSSAPLLSIGSAVSAARRASATGVAAAKRRYGRKVLAYVDVLARAGADGLADQQALAVLASSGVMLVGVSSVNSIRNSLGSLVEHTGAYDETSFSTKRGRYRLSSDGREWWLGRRA